MDRPCDRARHDRRAAPMSSVLRSDAGRLPLADNTVDLIVTSPPYFGLRSYTDGGEHYTGQVGDEDTPTAYLDRLIACTAEWMRVLKPSGNIFVNLGDKYASYEGNRGAGRMQDNVSRGVKPTGAGLTGGGFVKAKSLMMLPARYAIRCVDELGLIQRAEIIWSKPNGLPESVTDRVRRSHEQVFHFTKEPRYFAGVDEIREEIAPAGLARRAYTYNVGDAQRAGNNPVLNGAGLRPANPLGKLPGSVWTIPTASLTVPASLGVDHFAAFPPELVRRIVLGWSPREVCTACGQGRRPVAVTQLGIKERHTPVYSEDGVVRHGKGASTLGSRGPSAYITGYACACPDVSAPVTPGVCLDPFGGTGTTALVADCYGRVGISVDLSHDYSRLARWRTTDPGERARVLHVEKPPVQVDGQIDMFGDDPTQGEDEL